MFSRNCVRGFVLLALVVTLALIRAEAEQPFAFESTPGELPKNVVPRHYYIRIRPNLQSFTTAGQEVVHFEVLTPADEIILNTVDIKIVHAELGAETDTKVTSEVDPARQTTRFKFPKTLAPGTYRLSLVFEGRINEEAQGLFYEKYQTASGEKIMLGTQMEPADGRRMFPCSDEPAFRAIFELTVFLPKNFKAVSNMPIQRETMGTNGLNEVSFAPTPPMASYLVALAAGDFEEITDQVDGVQIRVITTEGKSGQGRYALAASKKLLAYYNDYFGVKYPLPKLDHIAIPGGFTGAMENWGAITYSDDTLLYDPKTSSPQTQRGIFITVAHEMSHQWFGDLVTTAWWDNLWLNEGFATWMETKATDHFNPDWELLLTSTADKSAVMSSDARRTTHAIQQPVENESQANDEFDSVTYQKGGAFLRMLEDYLGPELFRQGIQRYLRARSFSNATTADLWDALEQASGKPVRALSAAWTEQPGLPLVNMKTECVQNKQVVELKQERFTVQDPDAEPLRWQIPIGLSAAGRPGKATQFLLKDKSASVTLADCADVLKANAGDTGYYRVSYAPALFEKIRASLNAFSPADRLNLLDDSWAMVEAGRASTADYFGLVSALKGERTLAVWNQIAGTLGMIDDLEQAQPGRGAFRNYACALLQPELQRLGWEQKPGEPANDALLRSSVIAALGRFGEPPVIAEALARFKKSFGDHRALNPDLRPAILEIAGRYGGKEVYDQIHDLAKQSGGSEDRRLFYSALTYARNPELAQATLALSLTKELVPEEAADLVEQVAVHGEHQELAWDFATRHFPELLAKVDSFARDDYAPTIVVSSSDPKLADALVSFVKKNVSRDAVGKALDTAESVRFRAALKARELPVIDKWIMNTQTGDRTKK
jgi:aminopeptidase N